MSGPVYFSVRDIARILGWPYLKTWRWLRRADVLMVRGGRLVTTREQLAHTFPEVWHRIAQEAAEAEE